MTALLVIGVLCFIAGGGVEYAGFVLLILLVIIPINLYRAVTRAIDGNSHYTDPRTVEFSSTHIVVTGPNWRSELPWTMFRGFSEDATYFYLHLSDNGIASVIPKSSFPGDAQGKFREFAKAQYLKIAR